MIECEYELRAGSDAAADVEEGNDEVSRSALQALSQGVQAAVLYQNRVYRLEDEMGKVLAFDCILHRTPFTATSS